jgi:hypothetical protein
MANADDTLRELMEEIARMVSPEEPGYMLALKFATSLSYRMFEHFDEVKEEIRKLREEVEDLKQRLRGV